METLKVGRFTIYMLYQVFDDDLTPDTNDERDRRPEANGGLCHSARVATWRSASVLSRIDGVHISVWNLNQQLT